MPTEEEKSKPKDPADVALDFLRKSGTFKCLFIIYSIGEAYYMTMMGEVRGQFIVSPSYFEFDAVLHEENNQLIPVYNVLIIIYRTHLVWENISALWIQLIYWIV